MAGGSTRRSLWLGMLAGSLVGIFVGGAYAAFAWSDATVPEPASLHVERARPAPEAPPPVPLETLATQQARPLLAMALDAARAQGSAALTLTPGQALYVEGYVVRQATGAGLDDASFVVWRGETFRVTLSR